jgi:uncharacterized protein YdaU (DUF1376 family)
MAAESLAMMPWFPRDFLAATRGWSVTATGVYRALLDAQWDLGTLPNDPQTLKELIGATTKEWNAGWTKCESKFPVVEGGRRNERLELHRAKALRLSEKRRAIGQKGGQASAQSRVEPIGQAIAQPNAEAIGQAKVNHPSPSPSEEQEKNPAARATIAESEDLAAGLDLIGRDKRSLMGKLVKRHGASTVASKLSELLAMPEKPQDPAAYLVAAMKRTERRFVC